MTADAVVQLVLLVLVAMSIICWVIIFNKFKLIRHAAANTDTFLDLFWKSQRLDQVYDQANRMDHSPSQRSSRLATSNSRSSPRRRRARRPVSSMAKRTSVEPFEGGAGRANNLERMTTFLATTGSTAPLSASLGRSGILLAFQKIGATGQASLAVVGPDIAHALIATAIGLAARSLP